MTNQAKGPTLIKANTATILAKLHDMSTRDVMHVSSLAQKLRILIRGVIQRKELDAGTILGTLVGAAARLGVELGIDTHEKFMNLVAEISKECFEGDETPGPAGIGMGA